MVLAAIVLAACAPAQEPEAHFATPVPPAANTFEQTPADPPSSATFASSLATPIALTVTANRDRLPEVGELRTILPRDAIPAILHPLFLAPDAADEVYGQNEPVIGIEIDGMARAYSVPYLSEHEIVNDEVAGLKIAVTW